MRFKYSFFTTILIFFASVFFNFVHAQDRTYKVQLETTVGVIVLELNATRAPISVQNFLAYVNSGFYNGTIFHRVIDGFMVQGGGFTEDFQAKVTHNPIRNEANNGLKNERGTVAMARTNAPHSATSQFFINVANNDFLNYRSESIRGWGYTVFGKVVSGMDVIDKIRKSPTVPNGQFSNSPRTPITIVNALVMDELNRPM